MDNIRDKITAQLGFAAPTATDLVDRRDYPTEEKYMAALADMAAKLENPNVRDALRRASRERVDVDEKQERQRQKQEYTKIRESVKLNEQDEAAINAEATRLARADLAAGKITYQEVGTSIEKYASALEKKKLDSKATAIQFNMQIRGQHI